MGYCAKYDCFLFCFSFFSANVRRLDFAGIAHWEKKNEAKSKLLLFSKSGIFYLLDRKITVRSKIIYQLKRERQLSQHIKFNDFRLWTTRDVKNSTSKIGENICPQLTLIDKRFLLHSVIVITAYTTLNGTFYRLVKIQMPKTAHYIWIVRSSYHFTFLSSREERKTRDIKKI